MLLDPVANVCLMNFSRLLCERVAKLVQDVFDSSSLCAMEIKCDHLASLHLTANRNRFYSASKSRSPRHQKCPRTLAGTLGKFCIYLMCPISLIADFSQAPCIEHLVFIRHGKRDLRTTVSPAKCLRMSLLTQRAAGQNSWQKTDVTKYLLFTQLFHQ